jgi:hypothetical protein
MTSIKLEVDVYLIRSRAQNTAKSVMHNNVKCNKTDKYTIYQSSYQQTSVTYIIFQHPIAFEVTHCIVGRLKKL